MKLASNIIVREEKDCFLVYNGDNKGFISLTKKAYDELIIQDNKKHEGYLQLYNFLFQNNFLEEKPEKRFTDNNTIIDIDKDKDKVEKRETQYVNGYFSIKSHINPLTVIWAVTPLCNLHCLYCFPDTALHRIIHKTIPTKGLLKIANQLIASKVLRITLSGGECLLVKDIWKIVERLRSAGVTVGLISNGTTITDSVIEKLKKYKLSMSISLDAPNERINRITRGKNVFSKAVKSIKKLRENDISLNVLTTLTRHNFPFLSKHFNLLEKLGISSAAVQDLRPFATKQIYDNTRLTLQQEKELFKTFKDSLKNHPSIFVDITELFTFSRDNLTGKIMDCTAGDHCAYIDFYGDVYPCTSLPTFKMGNLLGDLSLAEIWQKSEAAIQIRKIKDMPVESIPECSTCHNRSRCAGGCRGDALFYNNDLFGLPSRCPKLMLRNNSSVKAEMNNNEKYPCATKAAMVI